MTTIKTIRTGSSGNCYVIESSYEGVSYHRLIIEAGVPFRCVQETLKFDLNGIDGLIISHEHKDHAGYADAFSNKGFPLYATKGTAEKTNLQRYDRIEMKHKYNIGCFSVMPFETEHDAAEPCGFVIDCPDGNRIVFATDTYYLKYKFPDVTVYMLECNYEEATLRTNINNGIVHPAVAERIKKSHMSLRQCVRTLKANDLSKTKAIVLIHLSADNSRPELFRQKVEDATGKIVYIAKKGEDYFVF